MTSGTGTCCPGRRGGCFVVATGNITNAALLGVFEANLDAVVVALGDSDFVELGPAAMVVHKRRGPS